MRKGGQGALPRNIRKFPRFTPGYALHNTGDGFFRRGARFTLLRGKGRGGVYRKRCQTTIKCRRIKSKPRIAFSNSSKVLATVFSIQG